MTCQSDCLVILGLFTSMPLVSNEQLRGDHHLSDLQHYAANEKCLGQSHAFLVYKGELIIIFDVADGNEGIGLNQTRSPAGL